MVLAVKWQLISAGDRSRRDLSSAIPPPTSSSADSSRKDKDQDKKIALSNEKVIGNGSFGVVFMATLQETGETVAIKKVLQDKRFKV